MLFHFLSEPQQYLFIFGAMGQIDHFPLVLLQIIQILGLTRFHYGSLPLVHHSRSIVFPHDFLYIAMVVIAHPANPRLMTSKNPGIHVAAIGHRARKFVVRVETIASAIDIFLLLGRMLSHERGSLDILGYFYTGQGQNGSPEILEADQPVGHDSAAPRRQMFVHLGHPHNERYPIAQPQRTAFAPGDTLAMIRKTEDNCTVFQPLSLQPSQNPFKLLVGQRDGIIDARHLPAHLGSIPIKVGHIKGSIGCRYPVGIQMLKHLLFIIIPGICHGAGLMAVRAVEDGKEGLARLAFPPAGFTRTLVPRLGYHLFLPSIIIIGLIIVTGIIACITQILGKSVYEIGYRILAAMVACTHGSRSHSRNQAKSARRRYGSRRKSRRKTHSVGSQTIHGRSLG